MSYRKHIVTVRLSSSKCDAKTSIDLLFVKRINYNSEPIFSSMLFSDLLDDKTHYLKRHSQTNIKTVSDLTIDIYFGQ